MENIVQLGFIYALKDPLNKEIFYIGATQTSLIQRLRTHYIHVYEAKRGKRLINRRIKRLIELLPLKAEIVLLDIIHNECINKAEIMHIKIMRNNGYPLLNETDGGEGGNTIKYKTFQEKMVINNKLSKALKGKKKPIGFAEKMSVKRRGLGNPGAKFLSIGWVVADEKYLFKYAFEINAYLKKGNASSNISNFFKKNRLGRPYNHKWTLFSDLGKETQDIVQSLYENKEY